MSGATLDHALAYAARGWPAFALSRTKMPLRRCEKCPPHGRDHDGEECEHLTCHGFYAATLDPDRLQAMFAGHGERLLAIRTGTPSGMVVVDVDPRASGLATMAGRVDDGLLPGTVMAQTGGGGLHLVYAHPGRPVGSGAGKLGPGVDVKADGGYIVVAPSVHPGTGARYSWSGNGRFDYDLTALHPGLAKRLVRTPPLPAGAPVTPRAPLGRVGGQRRLLGVLTTMLEAADGERNHILHWCAARVGDMYLAGELDDLSAAVGALIDAARQVGLPDGEIGDTQEGTIGSGLNTAGVAA